MGRATIPDRMANSLKPMTLCDRSLMYPAPARADRELGEFRGLEAHGAQDEPGTRSGHRVPEDHHRQEYHHAEPVEDVAVLEPDVVGHEHRHEIYGDGHETPGRLPGGKAGELRAEGRRADHDRSRHEQPEEKHRREVIPVDPEGFDGVLHGATPVGLPCSVAGKGGMPSGTGCSSGGGGSGGRSVGTSGAAVGGGWDPAGAGGPATSPGFLPRKRYSRPALAIFAPTSPPCPPCSTITTKATDGLFLGAKPANHAWSRSPLSSE